jgi:GxxExxY protein
MEFDELSNRVIGCAIEVHKHLGPGLLESAYERCLSSELTSSDIKHSVQMSLPVEYKGVRLECSYKIDMLVENSIIVELKSVDNILPVHEAQILTYMKLSGVKTGLLINFNVSLLKNGIKRFVL